MRETYVRLKKRRDLFLKLVRVGIAIAIALLICQFPLDLLETATYDWRLTYKPPTHLTGNIVTVTVDAKTLKGLERDPHASDHNLVLGNLFQASPKAIVYTFNPSEIVGSYDEIQELADVANSRPNLYYAANLLPKRGSESELKLPPPLEHWNVLPAPITSDKNILAKDSVTRRFIYSYEGVPTLHALLAEQFNGKTSSRDYQGLFDFIDTKQGYIDFHAAGTYPNVSFYDLIYSDINQTMFTNKIVFIGKSTLETGKDFIATPFTRDALGMTIPEVHANIVDTLIRDLAPIRLPFFLNVLLTCLASIVTLYVVISLRPTRGLMIILGAICVFALVCFCSFAIFRVWIGMAHPLLATFASYYFFIPYRLIMENRRSWEYFQRNRLLTQVEELKSNFLRMMSHDLKTPLARIQGMVDVLQGDSAQLNHQQVQALENIKASADELINFIGSVLSVSRIESQEIKLQLKSRDLNSLIHDVVKKCEFLAQGKNIQIITEFEPLFSLKIDEDLIRQVLTNLIENAIKYSPENSRIMVSTEEVEGEVIVQVADQGIGVPAEEVSSIFDKFYRSQNVKGLEVKGQGLGLYLSRYFVELHRGRIFVESEPAKGSTFTVRLPMGLET